MHLQETPILPDSETSSRILEIIIIHDVMIMVMIASNVESLSEFHSVFFNLSSFFYFERNQVWCSRSWEDLSRQVMHSKERIIKTKQKKRVKNMRHEISKERNKSAENLMNFKRETNQQTLTYDLICKINGLQNQQN
jgi:hypothetical protein